MSRDRAFLDLTAAARDQAEATGSAPAPESDRLGQLITPSQKVAVYGVLVDVPRAEQEPVVVMTVKVPRLLHGALKRRALELDRPIQELVRVAVEDLLERLEQRS